MYDSFLYLINIHYLIDQTYDYSNSNNISRKLEYSYWDIWGLDTGTV
jgi:hypothetical protein